MSTILNAKTVNFVPQDKMDIEGIGINKAISISNTKNNTAKIKNRSEKGIRAEL